MIHSEYMRRALRLAARGRTSPNPMVGAVVVKNGVIVGEGYHPKAGEPHAEIFALRKAGENAKDAVMYVTLEPCCHFGRTPPCTQAIIQAGISEVYAAMADPDENVACRGFKELTEAGVSVQYPVCEDEAKRLNEAYIKHRTTGMPFVTLKSAMSLDGRIATYNNDSKWITNEKSRTYVHKLRSRVDAVVVGANTARIDDPLLTARLGKSNYYPTRVIVTASGSVPANLRMLSEPGSTIIAAPPSADAVLLRKLEAAGARIITLAEAGGRPSIADLMRQLAESGHLSVLIEGGGGIAASALEERVVDKVLYFYAPRIIGGNDAKPAVAGTGAPDVASALTLDSIKIRRFGGDFAVEGYVVY